MRVWPRGSLRGKASASQAGAFLFLLEVFIKHPLDKLPFLFLGRETGRIIEYIKYKTESGKNRW